MNLKNRTTEQLSDAYKIALNQITISKDKDEISKFADSILKEIKSRRKKKCSDTQQENNKES